MMQPFRLAAGGRIDRTQALSFTFNDKKYQGFAGDTLASALLANGIHFVARSFKYHRPRGILSAGAEEPNALVQLEEGVYTEPNLRATQIELYDGLRAASVNVWPSLRYDWGALNDALSRFLVAGFYYKTFMRPRFLWERLYEPFLRRIAGMGRAPELPDPDIYDRMYLHCDVLVAGGGPAGISAALVAGRTGARVILCDDQNEFGGSLLSSRVMIDGQPTAEWAATALAELATLPEVVLLPRTTVFGYHDHNYLTLLERRTDHLGPGAKLGHARQRLWHIRAKEVVLATGAHERPLVFNGNDRPGVLLAGAIETYINRYAVRPGTRAVVFSNNDGAYRAALSLAEAGVAISAIVDLRTRPNNAASQEARRRGIPILECHAIVATEGRHRITAVEVMAREGNGVAGRRKRLECDLLAVSGGWNPAVHLFSQSRGRLSFDERIAAFVPRESAQRERSVGAARGSFALHDCLTQGFTAGASAAAAAGFGAGVPPPVPSVQRVLEDPLDPLWLVPTDRAPTRGKVKQFVDLQNDVTVADIQLAVREGFDAIEHTKRYTTAGMGTDQGKTGNVAALALLSETVGRKIAETGTTTFRSPYSPVTFGALAGREHAELADPIRVTPMHPWHVAAGAVFEDVGHWKRPRYYPRGSEDMDAAVRRECRAVRTSLGVQDVTTLGKIDARGRDVTEFLNRIYTNSFSKLDINRCRYGVMCGDDGMVFDDGVTTRLADDHFYMTTTTGGATRVLERLEEWLQTEWPDLEVYFTSVTDQWSAAAVAGPHARDVMRDLAPNLALDNESFPFLSMREASVAGLPARVFRISFSGELSYEINVAARFGLALWEAIMEAGARYNMTPYGTETMHVLRAEKGFIIVGQETDGTTTPIDLGMDWIVSKQKKDFIGKRSLSRPDSLRSDRKQLVGLLLDDPTIVLPEGTQLTDAAPANTRKTTSIFGHQHGQPIPTIGHVTSSYWSPTLGRGFALALVKEGRRRIGSSILAQIETGPISVNVVAPQFFDKNGVRQHG
jgi:sarcosine oxidase subunit alpha